jgi:hypothetical protein
MYAVRRNTAYQAKRSEQDGASSLKQMPSHDLLVAHLKALARDHHVGAAATKLAPFRRSSFDGIAQFGIIASTMRRASSKTKKRQDRRRRTER